MLEPIRRLLNEASTSTGTKAFWQAAARILSEWAGGALVQLDYRGLNESGAATAGTTASGSPVAVDWQDTDGRHVHGEFAAIPPGAGTGEALLTQNILAEPDCSPALSPSGTARGALIAPLRTAGGVQGAVGVVRYLRPDADEPPPFGLVDLQYFTAVAAYIAGGLELSEAVSGARAAAERARAMVGGSPLPLALVDGGGRGGPRHRGGGRPPLERAAAEGAQ